jgi:hypothetical protein
MRSLIWVLACAACGGPANVAGDWHIDLTNRDNGCMLGNWTVGDTASGIPVTITQASGDATADVGGLARAALDAGLAGHVFTGPVDGSDIDLQLFGMRSLNQGNCAFTYNAEIFGTVSGNTMTGEVHYTAATNNNPDCSTLQGCLSVQEFAGARNPQ